MGLVPCLARARALHIFSGSSGTAMKKEKRGMFEREGILMALLFLAVILLGLTAALLIPYLLKR